MENGGLSPNLNFGVLAPTASVRAADGHSPDQDAQGKSRRQSRQGHKAQEATDEPVETAEKPEHRLDRLA